jgi:hypothetical protein
MPLKIRINSRYALAGVSRFLGLLIFFCASFCVGYGQSASGQPSGLAYAADKNNVPDAIARIQSGQFSLVHVELIAEAHAVQAIPALKEQFASKQDSITRMKIAGALVRLGADDQAYWDFLVQQATIAVQSPEPRLFDDQGNVAPKQLSPAFLDWAKANNVSPDPVYILPMRVRLLGETGDTRAIPVLRQGLQSPNYFIQAAAARGLADVQDKDSIPFIIAACQRGPSEAAAAIAQPLVYFDDPRAQDALDTYVPEETVKVLRAAKAQGMKP